MKKKTDEIEIIEIFITLWKYKYRVFIITLLFFFLGLGYENSIEKRYIATTEIKKISTFEENLYNSYNIVIKYINNANNNNNNNNNNITSDDFYYLSSALGSFPNLIDKKYLENLFLEMMNDNEILLKVFKKSKLLDEKKYDDMESYSEAIIREINNFRLIPPVNIDRKRKEKTIDYWQIEYETLYKDRWNQALIYLNAEINFKIREKIISNFEALFKNIEKIREYELKNIDNQINIKKEEIESSLQLRLSFLKEQAAIARELDLAENNLKNQTYYTPSRDIADLQTEESYYLRGYKIIEKQIELVESNLNKEFMDSLEIIKLENFKKILISKDLILKEIEDSIMDTPISSAEFRAANIIFENTKYTNPISLIKILLFSTTTGLIFGIFYVIIYSTLKRRD